jgi:predicted membrane chloride channel (bestrophin family)
MRQRTDRNQSSTRLQESFLAVSAAVVAAFYAIMGVVLLVYPNSFRGLSPDTCNVLGIALLLYATFRGYRAYTRWNEAKK